MAGGCTVFAFDPATGTETVTYELVRGSAVSPGNLVAGGNLLYGATMLGASKTCEANAP